MLDIYEIRRQLEGLAAGRAAACITEEALNAMKETLELQRFYIESEKEPGENSDQIKNLDSRFHELLYTGCGSRPQTLFGSEVHGNIPPQHLRFPVGIRIRCQRRHHLIHQLERQILMGHLAAAQCQSDF